MTWARPETIQSLYNAIRELPAFDAHTHIQDDLLDFNAEMARQNLAGTQAAFNRFPQHAVDAGVRQGRLVRRTMSDATHAAFYSWFAEAAEGSRGSLDDVIALLGDNSEANRKRSGRALMEELHSARYSEYAEWLRIMYGLYGGLAAGSDPLAPENFEKVYDAVKARRNDPAFGAQVLKDARIVGYVTSIENRDRVPLDPLEVHPGDVDLSYATHPETWNMFDANYLLWPGGATDFGLFLGGYKYQAEKYLLNLEERLEKTIASAKDLKSAVSEFLWKILWTPRTNPKSRIRYTDTFQPLDFRFSAPWSESAVNTAIRWSKDHLEGDALKQVVACVATALLETLDEMGREMREHGEEYGSCLQIATGVTYFMDRAREIQSFPGYTPHFSQDEYAAWCNYPNIHFEYIVAQEMIYRDLANAAKQTGNIAVGVWWHFFRRSQVARMTADQMTMGPLSSIACGFTDARFVEMAAAKYQSIRWGLSMALAELVDDPFSSLFKKEDKAVEIAAAMLLETPCRVHHLPISGKSEV